MLPRIEWGNLVVGLVAWLGIAQFWGCVYVAIQLYPHDRPHEKFSLTENFFSDLGCTVTQAGQTNLDSALVFNRSVVALGVALIPFLWRLPADWEQGRTAMRVTGLVSAAGLIGVGVTPYDQFFIAHHIALGVWLVPLLLMVVANYAVMNHRGAASNGLFLVTALLTAAMLGYAVAGSHWGYVIFQKVTACGAVGWFVFVFGQLGIVTIQNVSRRNPAVEEDVRSYLETLESGHRRRRGRVG